MATPGKATAPSAPAGRDLAAGDLLDGKYRIEEKLGQGGMGAVYRAIHLGTRRAVAVKVIRPRLARDDEFVARFRREAEAADASAIRTSSTSPISASRKRPTAASPTSSWSTSTAARWPRCWREEGRLPRDWVVDILTQTCSAVGEAHRVGIIHRDLKPDNIWLEPEPAAAATPSRSSTSGS